MILIEIESTAIATKTGISEKTGKDWKMNLQQIAFVGHFVDGFPAKLPRESTIQLDEKDPKPFPVGRYAIAADSFFFGDFGRFTMGRMKLQPVDEYFKEIQKQFNCSISFQSAAIPAQPKAA